MGNEINAVIDKLCEKLGTSAQFLIPELAKLRIVNFAIIATFGLLITVVGAYYLPKAWRYDHRKGKDRFDDSLWVIVPGVITVVGFVCLTTGIYGLTGWMHHPQQVQLWKLSICSADIRREKQNEQGH